MLCIARGVLRRDERTAWLVVGVALVLWACGDLYWMVALADLAEQPYPLQADALWLSSISRGPTYVGIVLLIRVRMPGLDSRLWLDGVIAALATGALSAAIVFGAVHDTTGGDTATVATNLAYPLGDMILLGTIVGAMAAGRDRWSRTWMSSAQASPCSPSPTRSTWCRSPRKPTWTGRCSTSAGSSPRC